MIGDALGVQKESAVAVKKGSYVKTRGRSGSLVVPVLCKKDR